MVQSATDDKTRTEPAPIKIIAVGIIPATDKSFLAWQGVHCPRLGTRDAMLMYVRYLNGEDKIRFEQEMEQWKTYMRSRLPPHQREHLESLMANRDMLSASVTELKAVSETLRQEIILVTEDIAEHKALNETLSQAPQNTPQNILSLQGAQLPEHSPSPRTVFSPNPFRSSSPRTVPLPQHSAAQR